MIRRGSWVRAAVALGLLVVTLAPVAMAGATKAPSTNDNAKTLTVSVPGPFNGCSYLDAGATPTSDALGDLILPSAFQTSTSGVLYGEGGPIASAELTSLAPETVVYTIAPNQRWSDGQPFDGVDFVAWWQHAVSLASIDSDGYRDIKSMNVSDEGLTVTAVFSSPYAEWNLLFRDIEEPGAPWGCAVANLVKRPSLGAYEVESASANRVVLAMNRKWTEFPNRFGRIILTDSDSIPSSRTASFAAYSLTITHSQELALGAHPLISGHVGTSSNVDEVSFSPDRPLTSRLLVREGLSLSLNRQAMIDKLWGAVTFSPSPANSVLFSQGQAAYPGGNGSLPVPTTTTTSTLATTTTTSTTVPNSSGKVSTADCPTCALADFVAAGYHRGPHGLVDARGRRMTLQMVVGPGGMDHSIAESVARTWEALGVKVIVHAANSDTEAAADAGLGRDDVAVFSRLTLTTPAFAARSFAGPAYVDSYPSGVRSAEFTSLFDAALANFNPVTANGTWDKLDKLLMTSFWVRPLFTAPSLVEWSNSLNDIVGSLSVPGFLDELPGWTISPTTAS